MFTSFLHQKRALVTLRPQNTCMKYSWLLGVAAAAAVALPAFTRADDNLLWVTVNDAVLEGGDKVTLSWNTPSDMRADFVTINVVVPLEGKTIIEPIATNVVNTGTFTWTVPTIDAANVYFDVALTDLMDTVASGSTPRVIIGHPVIAEEPTDVPEGDVDGGVVEEDDILAPPAIISLTDVADRHYLFVEEGKRRAIADASWVATYDAPVVEMTSAEAAELDLDARAALPPSGAVVTVDLLPGYYLVTADQNGERLMPITERDARSRMADLGWMSALEVPYAGLWAGLVR